MQLQSLELKDALAPYRRSGSLGRLLGRTTVLVAKPTACNLTTNPRTVSVIEDNPLGIYVTDLTWTEVTKSQANGGVR